MVFNSTWFLELVYCSERKFGFITLDQEFFYLTGNNIIYYRFIIDHYCHFIIILYHYIVFCFFTIL